MHDASTSSDVLAVGLFMFNWGFSHGVFKPLGKPTHPQAFPEPLPWPLPGLPNHPPPVPKPFPKLFHGKPSMASLPWQVIQKPRLRNIPWRQHLDNWLQVEGVNCQDMRWARKLWLTSPTSQDKLQGAKACLPTSSHLACACIADALADLILCTASMRSLSYAPMAFYGTGQLSQTCFGSSTGNKERAAKCWAPNCGLRADIWAFIPATLVTDVLLTLVAICPTLDIPPAKLVVNLSSLSGHLIYWRLWFSEIP